MDILLEKINNTLNEVMSDLSAKDTNNIGKILIELFDDADRRRAMGFSDHIRNWSWDDVEWDKLYQLAKREPLSTQNLSNKTEDQFILKADGWTKTSDPKTTLNGFIRIKDYDKLNASNFTQERKISLFNKIKFSLTDDCIEIVARQDEASAMGDADLADFQLRTKNSKKDAAKQANGWIPGKLAKIKISKENSVDLKITATDLVYLYCYLAHANETLNDTITKDQTKNYFNSKIGNLWSDAIVEQVKETNTLTKCWPLQFLKMYDKGIELASGKIELSKIPSNAIQVIAWFINNNKLSINYFKDANKSMFISALLTGGFNKLKQSVIIDLYELYQNKSDEFFSKVSKNIRSKINNKVLFKKHFSFIQKGISIEDHPLVKIANGSSTESLQDIEPKNYGNYVALTRDQKSKIFDYLIDDVDEVSDGNVSMQFTINSKNKEIILKSEKINGGRIKLVTNEELLMDDHTNIVVNGNGGKESYTLSNSAIKDLNSSGYDIKLDVATGKLLGNYRIRDLVLILSPIDDGGYEISEVSFNECEKIVTKEVEGSLKDIDPAVKKYLTDLKLPNLPTANHVTAFFNNMPEDRYVSIYQKLLVEIQKNPGRFKFDVKKGIIGVVPEDSVLQQFIELIKNDADLEIKLDDIKIKDKKSKKEVVDKPKDTTWTGTAKFDPDKGSEYINLISSGKIRVSSKDNASNKAKYEEIINYFRTLKKDEIKQFLRLYTPTSKVYQFLKTVFGKEIN